MYIPYSTESMQEIRSQFVKWLRVLKEIYHTRRQSELRHGGYSRSHWRRLRQRIAPLQPEKKQDTMEPMSQKKRQRHIGGVLRQRIAHYLRYAFVSKETRYIAKRALLLEASETKNSSLPCSDHAGWRTEAPALSSTIITSPETTPVTKKTPKKKRPRRFRQRS